MKQAEIGNWEKIRKGKNRIDRIIAIIIIRKIVGIRIVRRRNESLLGRINKARGLIIIKWNT